MTTTTAYAFFCTVTLWVRRCVTVPAPAVSLKLQGKFYSQKNPKRTERQCSLSAFLMENSPLPVTLPSFSTSSALRRVVEASTQADSLLLNCSWEDTPVQQKAPAPSQLFCTLHPYSHSSLCYGAKTGVTGPRGVQSLMPKSCNNFSIYSSQVFHSDSIVQVV